MYMGNYPPNFIKDVFYNSKPHRSLPQKKKNDITLRVKLHTSNKKMLLESLFIWNVKNNIF